MAQGKGYEELLAHDQQITQVFSFRFMLDRISFGGCEPLLRIFLYSIFLIYLPQSSGISGTWYPGRSSWATAVGPRRSQGVVREHEDRADSCQGPVIPGISAISARVYVLQRKDMFCTNHTVSIASFQVSAWNRHPSNIKQIAQQYSPDSQNSYY